MLLFMLVLSLVAQACSASPTTQQPNKKADQHLKSIFILAGQSNMAGRGGVVNDTTTGIATWDGVVPPECRPNPSVFRLNVNLTWVKASEPLHADIDVEKTNGIGPGMAFAKAVLANHSSTVGQIGLVPCAIGGTNITEWRRGSFLYNQMIRRAKASLQNGGSIRALLWYQGESDTASREDALSYKNRLETFFGDVRLDLQSPDLPIIQVALASGYEATLIEIVREAQLGVDLLNVRTVDAKGLPLEPDGVHLTAPAQVELGKMLADAYLQFLPSAISNAPATYPNYVFQFVLYLLLKFLTTS
ncbi:probable carbohydrate esterase At4g34215 isoform X1 [Pyrus communis]|uniref:probable carbohydrate esterase At4g34215 isoform X1 n=1 Tax=Pyrus communis TaxID=23211 RepID=UPI0035C20022